MPRQPAPPAFSHLVDLAADETGTFIVYATDDYFGAKERLLRADTPVWKEDEYTDRGKWMDGWESMRRRAPGHDHVVLRLGTAGEVQALLCDTTHFKGNAPEAVSAEVCEAPATLTAAELEALPAAGDAGEQARLGGRAWLEVLPRTPVRADSPNELVLSAASPRATHLRLHIYPDGGVARLRAYGVVRPAPSTFWQPAAIDLAAIENGGVIAAASDGFFAPPANLLLPGRGATMGGGWETRRRRTPGADWCVVTLGRRGVVERLEVDTHLYKGNAPLAVRVECLDAEAPERRLAGEELAQRLRGADGWELLLEDSAVAPHMRHTFVPPRLRPATHLRVHIVPHGGVNRFRAFGHAEDAAAERARLDALHALPDGAARELLASFCGAGRWAAEMLGARPFTSVRSLFAAADAAFWRLDEGGLLEAFAAHPRLGSARRAAGATTRSAAWSRAEQSGLGGAAADVAQRLAAGNAAYLERFGFIFICCASGRSAAEILALLEARLGNRREQEMENAAREQLRITRLRIERWISE